MISNRAPTAQRPVKPITHNHWKGSTRMIGLIYLLTNDGEILRRFEVPDDRHGALTEWLVDQGFLHKEEDGFVAIGSVATFESRLDGTITHAFPKRVLQELQLPRAKPGA